MTYLERMKQVFHKTDHHCDCFKGNTGKATERWVATNVSFPRHKDIILNSTDLNRPILISDFSQY